MPPGPLASILSVSAPTSRRRGWLLAGLALMLAGVWLLVGAGSARAALPSNCSQSGLVVTCSFASTGAEQSFAVPAGVANVNVVAVGAAGGANPDGIAGGLGAVASGTVTVTGGETLYVEVGGAGADGSSLGARGFNGGGSSYYGGGGGGASDVRTDPASTPLTTTDSRLIVAAGGGGAGLNGRIPSNGEEGAGGAAGGAGANGSPDTVDGLGGGMGGGAGQSSAVDNGGAGGTAGPGDVPGATGGSGTLGSGGTGGGPGTDLFGGGGGGGVYGGGGGGGPAFYLIGDNGGQSGAGGGGGGSSLVPAGGSVTANSSGLASQVTISYTVPPAAPVCSGNSVSTAYQTATTVTFSCTGTGLTYSLVSGPSHGTLSAISGGQVTYTPNQGYSGPDSFVVQASDVAGQTATDTVAVTVGAAPSAPSVTITTPADGATYTQGQVIDAAYSCAEGANGPGLKPGAAGCNGTVANGAAINTATLGPQTFSVTATSQDGQTTTQTVDYTVVAVAKLADVSVSVTGPTTAVDGSSFSEVVTVRNAGPAAATGVITGLVIPLRVSVTNTGGGLKLGSAVYWADRSLAAGATVTYTVTVNTGATAHGTVAFAAASAATLIKDPNYANNAAINTVALGPASTPSGEVTRPAVKRLAVGSRLIGRLDHHTLAHPAPHIRHGHVRVDRRHRHA